MYYILHKYKYVFRRNFQKENYWIRYYTCTCTFAFHSDCTNWQQNMSGCFSLNRKCVITFSLILVSDLWCLILVTYISLVTEVVYPFMWLWSVSVYFCWTICSWPLLDFFFIKSSWYIWEISPLSLIFVVNICCLSFNIVVDLKKSKRSF